MEIQLEDAKVDRDCGDSPPVYPEAIALERAGDRLPDPAGGVGGELAAAAPVKLLDRTDAWRRHACAVAGGLTPEQWSEVVPEQDYIAACPPADDLDRIAPES